MQGKIWAQGMRPILTMGPNDEPNINYGPKWWGQYSLY